MIILASTHLGLPLSTTQVCTGAIFGAGAGSSFASVHWGRRGPAGTGLGGHPADGGDRRCTRILDRDHRHCRGRAVALGGVVLGAGIYAASRRDPVTALNVNDLPVPPLAQTAAEQLAR